MILAETGRPRIRNWIETDRDLFFEINSDPEVMAFFPGPRTRAQSDALFDFNRDGIAQTGYGSFALALKDDDKPVASAASPLPGSPPCFPDDTIEIGWRLAREHWS